MSDPTGMVAMNDIRERMVRWAQHAPEFTKKALMLAADVVIARSRKSFFATGGGEGGPLLHVRSGRLWRSIHKTVEVSGKNIKAEIGSNVIYARIHELGGEIRPVVAEHLKFQVMGMAGVRKSAAKITGGNWVTTDLVKMPARPYLSTALSAEKANIPRIILASLLKNWSKVAQRG